MDGETSDPRTPLAERITSYYRRLILDGDLAPADKIPSRREIAEEWRCGTGTANRAIRGLVEIGLVEPGRAGTVVSETARFAADRAMAVASNTHLASGAAGDKRAVVAVNVYTTAELIEAPPRVSAMLDLAEGAEVVKREWYRRTPSGVAVLVAESWAPGSHADANPLLLERADVVGGFEPALQVMGKTLGSVVERVRAELASSDVMAFYGLAAPAAMIVKDHVWLTTEGEPWTYQRAWHRPDVWSDYRAELT